MGLFDGMIGSAFGLNDDGRPVFYPYGPVGRGYVVTREAAEKLRTFLRIYYWLVLVGAIFAGTVLTRFGSRGVVGLLVLILVMLLGYEIRLRQLLRGAPRATADRGKGDLAQPSQDPPTRNRP
jgi:hypothetical protein